MPQIQHHQSPPNGNSQSGLSRLLSEPDQWTRRQWFAAIGATLTLVASPIIMVGQLEKEMKESPRGGPRTVLEHVKDVFSS